MASKKKKQQSQKVRVEFRKNRESRARQNKLTQEHLDPEQTSDLETGERLTGKGDLSRYRTIISVDGEGTDGPLRAIDDEACVLARILSTAGLNCLARTDDGRNYECTVRRVVRTISRDNRNAVVT